MKKFILSIFAVFSMTSVAVAGINTTIDAARDTKTIFATFTTTTTAATSLTFSVMTGGRVTLSSGSSYTVTDGKHFRVQGMLAACHTVGITPAASLATLKFRTNTTQIGQSYIVSCPATTTASAAEFPAIPKSIPDGVDFEPNTTFSWIVSTSTWSSTCTQVIDLTLFGYEY